MSSMPEILQSELAKRKELNPSYSLRAFAKFLDISPATLSQVISEKRHLGRKGQEKILDKLGIVSSNELSLPEVEKPKLKLEEDIFEMIAKWHYFAILSLSEVKGAKADPRWIGSRLGISAEDANRAISRLERLGIIEIYGDNSFRQVSPPITTTDEVPSVAIQKFHQGLLSMAQLRIEQVPVEEREYRSLTFAGNSKKIKKAKKLIKQLKDLVSETMESGTKDNVYQFSVQLFPLTRGEEK